MKRIPAVLLLTVLPVSASPGGGAAAGPPDWAAVSAIFVERCVMCHSAQAASLGLRLDSYEGALAGSIKGAVVVPGNPDGSELLRRLRGESVPRMPFLSYPLPPEQIDLISQWVRAGLPEAPDVAVLPRATGPATDDPIGGPLR